MAEELAAVMVALLVIVCVFVWLVARPRRSEAHTGSPAQGGRDAGGQGKKCPRCGLLNLDSALACDCGRLFEPTWDAGSPTEVAEPDSRSSSFPEHRGPHHGPRSTVGTLILVVALLAGAVGLGIVFGKRSDGSSPRPASSESRVSKSARRATPAQDTVARERLQEAIRGLREICSDADTASSYLGYTTDEARRKNQIDEAESYIHSIQSECRRLLGAY
jgi:hypothetical protein